MLFTNTTAGYETAIRPTRYAWEVYRLDDDASVRSFDAPRWLWLLGIDWHLSRVAFTTTPAPAFASRDFAVSIPLWLPIGALATGGFLLTRRNRLHRRRVRNGQCPMCGYDCHMTPARCPECGFADAIASA